MTIREAQEKVDAWINTHGVRYFNELTNMALICLANQTGTDLSSALESTFEKKTNRDLNRHKTNSKLK